VAEGKNLMGPDPKRWKWGSIHKCEFQHPLTARSKFLEAAYHVGPIELSGWEDTVNYAGWRSAQPFQVDEGVSLRETQDMTEPPQLYAVNPMGESGQFFSSHYKDQTDAWLNGRASRDPTQAADIRKDAFSSVLFRSVPTATISLRK
jgi:penicillin amidase